MKISRMSSLHDIAYHFTIYRKDNWLALEGAARNTGCTFAFAKNFGVRRAGRGACGGGAALEDSSLGVVAPASRLPWLLLLWWTHAYNTTIKLIAGGRVASASAYWPSCRGNMSDSLTIVIERPVMEKGDSCHVKPEGMQSCLVRACGLAL